MPARSAAFPEKRDGKNTSAGIVEKMNRFFSVR